MAFPLALMGSAYIAAAERGAEFSRAITAIENAHSLGAQTRNVFSQVLKKPWGKQRDGADNAALMLSRLEMALEGKFGAEGIAADAWLGACGYGEIEKMRAETAIFKRPTGCEKCSDLGKKSPDFSGEDKFLSASFTHGAKGLKISKQGLSTLPETLAAKYASKPICFGVTYYREEGDIAAVVLMPEGFE